MSSNQDQRPRFFQGQYLGAEDLSAAVDYSRAQMSRLTLGAHSWGIATGLQIQEKNLSGGRIEIFVLPGYAWDGFGRPITLLAPYKIPTELFKSYVFDPAIDNNQPEGRLIEVWLRYDEEHTRNVRPGFDVCDIEDQNSRVQETFRVELGARPNHIDRHDRIRVAGYSIDAQEVIQKFDPQSPLISLYDESVPYQDLPDSDTNARWLIPLGYVRWKPNPNPNQSGNFIKRGEEDLKASRRIRRYIGVVAESVQAADGILRMRDRSKDYSPVQSDDLVWVEGKLRVDGDIRPFGGKLDFRHIDGRDFDIPLKIQRSGDLGAGSRALQVIVGTEAQTNNRFAVGPLKADGTVAEKFVVLSGGNVGIGTTFPQSKLQIKNLTTIDEGGGAWANFGSNAYYDGAWKRIDNTKAGVNFHINADDGADQEFRFLRVEKTGAQRNIAVIGTGLSYFESKVGIGTSVPNAKLQVVNGAIMPAVGNSPTAGIQFPSDPGGGGFDEAFIRYFVEVGETTKLLIGCQNDADDSIGFFQFGAERMTIRNGNVGIGTTVPSARLHVNGNIEANGPGNFNGSGSFNGNVNINGTLIANVKNFQIPHPLNPDNQYLIHSSLEGPEIAVFYRGSGQLSEGKATIILPDYFEMLTRKEGRTVLLTPRFDENEMISPLAASEIIGGQFKVRASDDNNLAQKFYWEVKAIRADVDVLNIVGK